MSWVANTRKLGLACVLGVFRVVQLGQKAGGRGQRKRGAGHGENVGLLGRGPECALLDQMIAAVRMGESRVLLVHGAPGVGKSALLEYAENAATGMRVLRAAGVESEMELAFATLHQLCAPLLDRWRTFPRRSAMRSRRCSGCEEERRPNASWSGWRY